MSLVVPEQYPPNKNPHYTKFQTIGIWLLVAATSIMAILVIYRFGSAAKCNGSYLNVLLNPFNDKNCTHVTLYVILLGLMLTSTISFFKPDEIQM